jgi:3',5'-cyclic AMP phosphodiesterase CpdA
LFLRSCSLSLLGVALGGCGSDNDGPSSGGFGFAALNDLHFRDAADVAYFEALAAKLGADPQIQFVVISGDLTENGSPTQLQTIKSLLEGIGKPWYAVPGNHDNLTQQTTWDTVLGARNVAFDHDGWTFLGFDSTRGGQVTAVTVTDEVLQWLATQIAGLPADRPIVAFTHFPLAASVPGCLANADEVFALFAGHDLRHILSGHFHAQTSGSHGSVSLTTCTCLSPWKANHDATTQKGYLKCRSRDRGLWYQFTPFQPLLRTLD